MAPEIIRRKRDGQPLERAEIDAFVRGLVDGSWSDAQAGAMTMALFLKGLSPAETVALTEAMTHSGAVLDWHGSFPGPVLDKHSSGGVGDKVSLILAPVVAACGGIVPMISGRMLGHTGGTLDKLDSIPGYRTAASLADLETALRKAGCAIVGASAEIAPADRRLYAIRDLTATVASIPLICASILSKKLAEGLDALVLDVKVGNGAFARDLAFARALAEMLTEVATAAGLDTRAWITDMNQVLGHSCGNAVEVREAIRFLAGDERDPRLAAVARRLAAELLVLGGIERDISGAESRVNRVLDDGSALEHFSRMVAALGGPPDLVENADARLPHAPVQRPLTAHEGGWIHQVRTRSIALACIELGGGRHHAEDLIDHRVGFTHVAGVGRRVERGEPLAMIHAARETDVDAARAQLANAFVIRDSQAEAPPVLVAQVESKATTPTA
jgi:thymidine phosphorylase